MIDSLINALLHDYIVFLKKHGWEDSFFFGLMKYSSEKALLNDLLLSVKMMADEIPLGQKSVFLSGFSKYLISEFPKIFDQLDRDFATSKRSEQEKKLLSLIPEQSFFFQELRTILFTHSMQEVSEEIQQFLQEFSNGKKIIVQSPRECEASLKSSIRDYLSEEYPTSFTSFTVNRQLIGGIRFFLNGQVEDFTWLSKIQRLSTLRYHL